MKTSYGKDSRYPTDVCPLPDEGEITVLESATKCSGYSSYVSHTCRGKITRFYGKPLPPEIPYKSPREREAGRKRREGEGGGPKKDNY